MLMKFKCTLIFKNNLKNEYKSVHFKYIICIFAMSNR